MIRGAERKRNTGIESKLNAPVEQTKQTPQSHKVTK